MLDKEITIQFENISLEDALEQINLQENIAFTYSKELVVLNKNISSDFQNKTVRNILLAIFEDTGISFITYSNHIILQQKKPAKNMYVLKGSIKEKENNLPIPYATVQIKNTTIGTITDNEGRFELPFDKKYITDTVIFSYLGYEQIERQIQDLNPDAPQLIFMSIKIFVMNSFEVHPSRYEIFTVGNDKKVSTNNLYIDTHGQQSVLYVKNKKNTEGKIVSVNYFLSKKGNCNAPFRIRVYAADSTGKPGADLLPHMIVVKPDKGQGWFSVNISDYNVKTPDNGFFIGIEGVYPNDFLNSEDNLIELTEKEIKQIKKGELAYGQEIGCVRKKNNNTWHYSLSHTWFKASYTNLEIMVYAVIKYKIEETIADINIEKNQLKNEHED